jgi:hypothetical protein
MTITTVGCQCCGEETDYEGCVIEALADRKALEEKLREARRETAEECARMIEAATRGQAVRPRPSTQWGDLMAAEIRSRFGSEGEKK